MRKSTLSLTLLALVAGTAATALAQGLPTTQPKFLHIYREQIKAGRLADHSRWEAGWPAAFEKAKFPDSYIALESVTGPTEVWYLSPYASQAAYGESAARQNADAALSAETERLARGDAEFVSEMNAIQAVARPELSHGAFPDLAMMRFWDIGTFRVKPGHGEEFEAAVKAYGAASGRSSPNASWRTYEVVAGAPDGPPPGSRSSRSRTPRRRGRVARSPPRAPRRHSAGPRSRHRRPARRTGRGTRPRSAPSPTRARCRCRGTSPSRTRPATRPPTASGPQSGRS